MADRPDYGASQGDWRDTIRHAQESGRSSEEMRQKDEARQQTEERGQSLDRTSARTRGEMSDATATLTDRLGANTRAIEAETAALQTNVALMRDAVALRREMSQLPLVSTSERASASRVAAGGTSGVAAGVAPDPNAGARLREAERRLAAAEIAAQQARTQVGRASRQAGAASEDVAPLVAQREAANRQLQLARSGLREAQTNVDLQAQINAERQRDLEILRQTNAADERAQAEAQRRASQASSFIESTAPTVAGRTVLPSAQAASFIERTAPTAASRTVLPSAQAASFIERTAPTAAERTVLPTSRGPIALLPESTPTAAERIEQRIAAQGIYSSAGATVAPAAEPTTAQAAYAERVRVAREGLAGLSTEQARANQAFQQASADYADASNALSRHGALTTEFIQALARGEVTLAEFGSQVTATIGKFGGWAIAGAAVYGVVDALRHVVQGATETQGAIQNLGRFLPGLGGPAGGGSGQVGQAQATLRDISVQFNEPISQVSSAMQVMARTFHSVAGAGDATRAALAAYRLDQVPLSQSEQYLVGIANTMGLGGRGTIGVVNSLNALQAQYGVRVQQSLPGLARAVPAARASGIGLPDLEALVGLGVRAGITGPQIGTALVRSMTNFAFRPSNAPIFGQFGITPQQGQYGDLMRQVMRTIDVRAARGTLTGRDLTALASALGGPQLGGRTILPILEQQALSPGAYQRYGDTARQPRDYQRDLSAQLGSISERFRSIGVGLGAFGSELGNISLAPIVGLLDVTQLILHAFETLLSPLAEASHIFASLPGPVRDLLGILVALRVGRAIAASRWGGATQSFVGRLPGLGAFGNQDREIVDDAVSRMRNYVLPSQRQAAENASARSRAAEENRVQATRTAATHLASNADFAGVFGDENHPQRAVYQQNPAYLAYEERATALHEEQRQAESQAAAAARQADVRNLAFRTTRDIDLPMLSDRSTSYADRAQYAQRIGMVAQEGDNAAVEELKAQRMALMESIRTGTQLQTELNVVTERAIAVERPAPSGIILPPGVAMAGGGADVGAATNVAMTAAARNQSGIDNIVQAVDRSPQTTAQRQAADRTTGRMPTITTPPPITGFADLGWAAADRISGIERAVTDRVGAVTDRVGTGLSRVTGATGMMVPGYGEMAGQAFGRFRDTMTSPMAPLGLLMGAGMLAPVLPGALSRTVSGPVSTGLMGAMMMQMMGRGGFTNMGLGYTAGTVLGAAQQGGAQGGELAAGGALAGAGLAAAGVLFAPATMGLSLVPALVAGLGLGATAGAFVDAMTGSQPTSVQTTLQDHARQATRTAQRAVSQANALDPHGGFLSQFSNALLLGGNAGTNAQTQASAQLQQLQAEQLLFGPNSVTGRQARTLAASAIESTVAEAPTNPAAAQAILQAADQTRQTAIQNQFRYGLATSRPGQEWNAFSTAQRQSANEIRPYTIAARQTQQSFVDAQGELTAAFKTGNTRLIDQQRQATQDALTRAQGARGLLQQEEQTRGLNIQQYAQAAYQVQTQNISAAQTLAQARAGGDVMAQAQAQIAGANRGMRAAIRLSATDPQQGSVDYRNQLAQRAQGYFREQTQGLTMLQSQGAVAEAQVFTGDPIGQARVNAQNLAQQWKYMQQHARAFDPSQILQAQAAAIAAQQQYAQTISDVNTQMIQLETQTQQAQAYGDAAAQAARGVAGAYRQLAAARTPVQHQAALNAIANANAQTFQSQTTVVQSQAALAEAQLSGDPVAQAGATVRYAQRLVAVAHGIDNQRQAEANLAIAQYGYQQALEQRDVALGQLAASSEVEPAAQLTKQLTGISRALAVATHPADRNQLRTQYNTTRIQLGQTLAQTSEDTIDFQFQMMQISSGTAANELERILRNNRFLTNAMRQQFREKIRQYRLGLVSPIGGNQFDLAPGNIRLPTYLDVAGGITRHNIHTTNVHHNPQTTVNVYVRDHRDVPKVADAIDRASGSTVRRRLRAARAL